MVACSDMLATQLMLRPAGQLRGYRAYRPAMSASTEEPKDPYEELGETARREVDKARKDPRLERERAAVADFWDAMDEAERVRKLAIRGSEMIRESDPIWAMAELAAGDIRNDFPGLNAQALIAMNSALDSMVEEFAPAMREILVKAFVDQALKQAEEQVPDAAADLDDERRDVLREVFQKTVTDLQPKLLGSGAERYEKRLRGVGLGTAEDRPIPGDLDEALTELGAIRDVLIHRASRVDSKALEQAPSLAARYQEGQLVRLTREDYRRYTAAIRCYGQDVAMRPMRSWPNVTDDDLPDLAAWRNWYVWARRSRR
jgi:hypothetical protein